MTSFPETTILLQLNKRLGTVNENWPAIAIQP